MFYLTEELKDRLKKPFGLLIKNESIKDLPKTIENEKPKKLVCVGDMTSAKVQDLGIAPDIIVIDNKIARKSIKPSKITAERVYKIENRAGTLSDEACKAVAEAVASSETAEIIVDGEEDLLVMLAVLEAPEGSVVLYGQPNEGVVMVRVTKDSKERVKHLMDEMRKT